MPTRSTPVPHAATLTLHPAIDLSTPVARLFSDGTLQRPGGSSLPMHLAGGPTGARLTQRREDEGLRPPGIPVRGWTRENLTTRREWPENQGYTAVCRREDVKRLWDEMS